MGLTNTIRDSWKFIGKFIVNAIAREGQENALLFFVETNDNPLVQGRDSKFIAVSAILGTVLVALKLLFRAPVTIFRTLAAALLIAAVAYVGLAYFRWINRMAEEQKIAGIALSLLAIAAVIIII
ncbi:hypothetical protein COV21_03380 [Candidatus Woesearchaeota archaeon CG10_big_fil_rev_8_21_14_0_10_45_5]|jgi:hypothetical protein|nr:MAG: hypothetical protein COV21_03380 [Candidatus Woesearchaeota archaeon CG10_big_fil_rev_8_21_14_0_10_45_5]PIU30172.1 MAG: hypothetical protein COT07_02150 [Candidatus Woesearchaeota archaeon CG07_land_8_20_14_0_80_44_23]